MTELNRMWFRGLRSDEIFSNLDRLEEHNKKARTEYNLNDCSYRGFKLINSKHY